MVNQKILNSMNGLLSNFNKSKVSNLEEWKSLPLMSKEDLIDFSIPRNFKEVRATSGSTGESLFIYFSEEAISGFVGRAVKFIKKMNLNKDDLGLILFSYGNFIVGSMVERACNKEKIPIIPFGSTNTYQKENMLKLISLLKPNIWFSTPTYALKLLSELGNKSCFPKKILVGGEKLINSYIKKFKEYNIELFNLYGLTECNPVGFSDSKNPKKIIAIYPNIYLETIETMQGKELVVTDFTNTSTPIIRYKTKDLVKNIKVKRGIIKEFEIVSRNDDLIKLRGAFVSKSKIIEVLSNFSLEFVVYLLIKNDSDFIQIYLPAPIKEKEKDLLKALQTVLGNNKREVLFKKDLIVPKTNSNKPKYIVDIRN